MRVVAALYVDARGPYPLLAGVDAWDEARDARGYRGPHPIVAHPPCGAYSRLRHLRASTDDADCGLRAVGHVRRYGGVVEQPANSRLWGSCGIPRPGEGRDAWGGYSILVAQCEWGHVARKKTWLYLVGVPITAIESPPFGGRAPTHWASGARPHARKGRGSFVPDGIKVCSGPQRNRTPQLFAEYLVRLARAVPSSRDAHRNPAAARR